jgi:hypothetical protein
MHKLKIVNDYEAEPLFDELGFKPPAPGSEIKS